MLNSGNTKMSKMWFDPWRHNQRGKGEAHYVYCNTAVDIHLTIQQVAQRGTDSPTTWKEVLGDNVCANSEGQGVSQGR